MIHVCVFFAAGPTPVCITAELPGKPYDLYDDCLGDAQSAASAVVANLRKKRVQVSGIQYSCRQEVEA